MRARIVVVKSDPSSALGLPDVLDDKKQMVVYHSELTVLPCSSVTIVTCPVFFEKTGNHLLGSASCASNFYCIWLILKHPYSRLLFTFGLTYVNLRFITCYDVIDVFRSTAIGIFIKCFICINVSRLDFFDLFSIKYVNIKKALPDG